MKRFFKAAVAFICLTMAGMAFIACGGDDEIIEPPVQTRTLTAAEIYYLVHMPYNGRNICNYIVTYTEADGQDSTGILPDSLWIKKITVKNFPFTATIKMNVQRNEKELKDSVYDFRVYYSIFAISSIYSDSTKEETYRDMYPSYAGVPCRAERVEDYVAERLSKPDHLRTKTMTISTDGKVLNFE